MIEVGKIVEELIAEVESEATISQARAEGKVAGIVALFERIRSAYGEGQQSNKSNDKEKKK